MERRRKRKEAQPKEKKDEEVPEKSGVEKKSRRSAEVVLRISNTLRLV